MNNYAHSSANVIKKGKILKIIARLYLKEDDKNDVRYYAHC